MYSEIRLSQGAALWRSSGAGGAVIPADGCVDLILRDGRVWVAGPSTRWIASESDGVSGSFGLRLPPGRAHHVLGPGLGEVADQLVPLDDLTRCESAQQMREVMLPFGDAPRPTAAVAALIDRAEARSLWSATAHRWAMDAAPAKHVAASFGESERTFRRNMIATFGYGYATLVRIERARRARALLRSGASLTEAAVGADFADQPHLSREFRRLVGMSPGQFAGSSA